MNKLVWVFPTSERTTGRFFPTAPDREEPPYQGLKRPRWGLFLAHPGSAWHLPHATHCLELVPLDPEHGKGPQETHLLIGAKGIEAPGRDGRGLLSPRTTHARKRARWPVEPADESRIEPHAGWVKGKKPRNGGISEGREGLL